MRLTWILVLLLLVVGGCQSTSEVDVWSIAERELQALSQDLEAARVFAQTDPELDAALVSLSETLGALSDAIASADGLADGQINSAIDAVELGLQAIKVLISQLDLDENTRLKAELVIFAADGIVRRIRIYTQPDTE